MATPDQYDRMHQMLRERGVFPASWSAGDAPTWETETGHHFSVSHGHSYGWGLSMLHMGDPVGAGLHVPLGQDDETAASRVAAEMRHPETLGHLRDQYNRARLNNDPTGHDPQARRVPFATGDWVNLDHYRD
jgi:hypothetical protein